MDQFETMRNRRFFRIQHNMHNDRFEVQVCTKRVQTWDEIPGDDDFHMLAGGDDAAHDPAALRSMVGNLAQMLQSLQDEQLSDLIESDKVRKLLDDSRDANDNLREEVFQLKQQVQALEQKLIAASMTDAQKQKIVRDIHNLLFAGDRVPAIKSIREHARIFGKENINLREAVDAANVYRNVMFNADISGYDIGEEGKRIAEQIAKLFDSIINPAPGANNV